MMFMVLTLVLVTVIGAEETKNEIPSNNIIENSSAEKSIEPRQFVDTAEILARSSPGSARSRRGRYLRQAPRPRRRPPYDYPGRKIRRPPTYPSNNFPNLYGPRNRFHPSSGPYRPGPQKSRYRYYRDWHQKWPESNQPFYIEDEEMEVDSPYEEYDDVEDYSKSEDPWYSKKHLDSFEDIMPVSSKYNEKRSPARYYDFPRPKMRGGNFEAYRDFKDFKDPMEWQERNRFIKNYRGFAESMYPSKKFVDDEMIAKHRFKFNGPHRLKGAAADEEYDFSGTTNLKTRRLKGDNSVIRRPSVAEENNRFEDMSEITKYITNLNALPTKETVQEPVYSAKYRGHQQHKEEEEKSKKSEDNQNIDNEVNDWKRAQKQPQFQFASMNKAPNAFDKVVEETSGGGSRSINYKDDRLLPSELIAYMSADPAESAVVGKEERYLHSSYPFIEKLSDQDVLKMSYPRKISPIIEQDLEITFDERSMADWKH